MVAPPSTTIPSATTTTNANTKVKVGGSRSSKGKRRKLPKTTTSQRQTLTNGGAVAAEAAAAAGAANGGGNGNERKKGSTANMDVDDDSSSTDKVDKAARAMIEQEKPRLWRSLEELRDRAKDVEDKVAALAGRAKAEMEEDPGPRDEGASFLGLKQTLLLSYCRELCSYAAAKGRGEALRGGGAAGRLVELRTVMEKLRPMDRKLKYQTDKLLRLASSSSKGGGASSGGSGSAGGGNADDEDPLSFRPRPDKMAPWGEDPTTAEGGDGGDSRDASSAAAQSASTGGDDAGLYRAPRLASMPYDEDGLTGGAARGEKRLERRRDKLRRGEVLETLREEFGEQPETVRAVGNAGASGVSEAKMKKLLEEDKERVDFEEDHMVRLTVTRKAKKARARMEKEAGRLETIADVGSAADFVRVARDADGFGAAMEGGEDDVFGGGVRRGRRKSRGGGALGRAMGAVGGSLSEAAGGGGGKGMGKKKQRRR
eukprot:g17600.t1